MKMLSVTRIKFIKTKVIFRDHTKGVSNLVSSNLDHKIKSYSCSNSAARMKKNEKRDNKGITNRDRFQRLEIKPGGIKNRDSFRDFKSGQKHYNSEQGFQIRAKTLQIVAEITRRGKRDFKLGQGL